MQSYGGGPPIRGNAVLTCPLFLEPAPHNTFPELEPLARAAWQGCWRLGLGS